MIDNFDGDPKMFITADGADFSFSDGQPIMDSGLENNALISLFTREGWAGNILLPAENQVGSDFEENALGSLTLAKLSEIQNSADRALNSVQQKVTSNQVMVSNATGKKLDVSLKLSPVAEDPEILLSSDAGLNWRAQALNPAHRKV